MPKRHQLKQCPSTIGTVLIEHVNQRTSLSAPILTGIQCPPGWGATLKRMENTMRNVQAEAPRGETDQSKYLHNPIGIERVRILLTKIT